MANLAIRHDRDAARCHHGCAVRHRRANLTCAQRSTPANWVGGVGMWQERQPMTQRIVSALVVVAATGLGAAVAAADPMFAVRTEAALGPPEALKVVTGQLVADALARCSSALTGEPPATTGAIFWLELGTKRVVGARVAGTGKPALDNCLTEAVRRAVPPKLAVPIVVVGRIDVPRASSEGTLPAAKLETTPIVVAAHDASWQWTTQQIGYTAHGAAELAKALNDVSQAIAACAPKRGAKAQPAEAMAMIGGGKPMVRSGTPLYDDCAAKALEGHQLPTPASAAWIRFHILPPAEPLSPRTAGGAPRNDRTRSLRDALTTAARARKAQLRVCNDVFPDVKIATVTITLASGKARLARGRTGNNDAEACLRTQFGDVAIPSAQPEDRLELDVDLDVYE